MIQLAVPAHPFRALRPWLLGFAALCLLGTADAAQKIGEVPRFRPAPSAEPGEVLEWTSEQGQPYWYRIPKKKRGKRKPSLVFMLHGTGLNHGWSFWNYPIANGGFRPDDIVVSPDGLTPGSGDTFNFVQNNTDGDQIVGLIETFRSQFDVGNVYLYGHSQGAFFCYWFAGEHPELVDGIIAHAGNVLNVKHSKLAKEKVAIGILHARSDQVVTVECAERTEKIYRDEGYQKLKCWIVEGIRDQAGHWPLPDHVSTMFEWLDEVSVGDASQAVEVARSALSDKEPNFAVAAAAAASAREQIRKYKGDDKDEVTGFLTQIEEALDVAAAAATEVVLPLAAAAGKGREPGPWAEEFRWCQSSFGAVASFQKGAKALVSAAGKHNKDIAKLDKIKDKDGKKYAKAALKALESDFLGSEWEALLSNLSRRAKADSWAPMDGFLESVTAAGAAAQLPRTEEDKGGTPALESRRLAEEALTAFMEAHPTLAPSKD